MWLSAAEKQKTNTSRDKNRETKNHRLPNKLISAMSHDVLKFSFQHSPHLYPAFYFSSLNPTPLTIIFDCRNFYNQTHIQSDT